MSSVVPMKHYIPKRNPKGEPRVLVYSPLHKRKDVMVVGENYRFPPHGIGTCTCGHHNIPGAVDNIGIHAAYEHPRDEAGVMDTSRRKVGGEGTLTADEVARLVVSPAIMGPLGFIILDAGMTMDEMRAAMLEADAKEIERSLQEYQDAIDGWEAYVVKFTNDNPGKSAPPRPPRIREAYEYRREHRGHVLSREVRKQFICDYCGDEYDKELDRMQHVRDEHPGRPLPAASAEPVAPPPTLVQAPEEKPEEELTQDEEEQPTMGAVEEGLPTEPPKPVLQLNGPEVLQRAERGKVVLSLADRKGLSANDPDIIADVEARIDAAHASARANRPARGRAAEK